MKIIDLLKLRRSQYDLTAVSALDRKTLLERLASVIEQSPTGFNSQSSRIVVLYDGRHEEFWNLVLQGIDKEIGHDAAAFEKSRQKIAGLSRSAGTILFFENEKINSDLKDKFPLYAANISVWAEQSQGMLQLAVWTMLAEAGMGASLQHYAELVAPKLQTMLSLDPDWRLVAQMPFGIPNSHPAPKAKVPGTDRVIVLE
ncbi:MAG: nitroreductase family protein [Bacilli bacterium]